MPEATSARAITAGRIFAGLLVVPALLVSACAGTAASTPSGLTAYVTNAQDNGKSPGVGSVIPVGLTDSLPGTPIELGVGAGTNDIVVTADGTTAYVTNEYTNSVSRIDLATGAVGDPITVGDEPVQIAFVPQSDEKWAWVANYGGKSISTVNLVSGEVGQTIEVPFDGPNTVAFTPDGRTCYVANWGTDSSPGSTVTPITVTEAGAGGEVLASIDVGLNPNWIALSKDGSTAYVANKGSSSVTPISVRSNEVGDPIPLPGPAIQLEVSPDGRSAYVAVAGSSPAVDAVVPLDLTVTPAKAGQPIALPPGTQPHWVGFTPDGATAYVVGNGNSTLTPITVATGAAGAPIHVSTDADSDLLAIAIAGG